MTGADGNVLQTIDGRPAQQVWDDQIGGAPATWPTTSPPGPSACSSPRGTRSTTRPDHPAVFGFRPDRKEIVLQAPIAAGTRVQLCHRTPHAVFDRAIQMATRLRDRLAGARPLLALGFECGARPGPFLGPIGRVGDRRDAADPGIGPAVGSAPTPGARSRRSGIAASSTTTPSRSPSSPTSRSPPDPPSNAVLLEKLRLLVARSASSPRCGGSCGTTRPRRPG